MTKPESRSAHCGDARDNARAVMGRQFGFSARRRFRAAAALRRHAALAASAVLAVVSVAAAMCDPGWAAAPSPTLRPTLVSGDPAGDEGVSCYLDPRTFANGYTETPRAVAPQCGVEITDTLRLEFGSGSVPARLLIKGPEGFSKVVSEPELYIDLGMPLGDYRFEGAAGGRDIVGGFAVKLSSKRVAQLRFRDIEGTAIDHLALAGYRPSSRLTLYRYDQVSFQPNVGTGTRTWRLGPSVGEVAADVRGEARVDLPRSLFLPDRNYVIVSDPMQENSLNSARVMGQR